MSDLAAVLARLDKITPHPWRAGRHGYVFGPDCQIGVVGDYRDKELLLFNKERWDADARAIALVPELIAVVPAAMELRAAFVIAFGNQSPFAKTAIEKIDAALSALAKRGME